MKVSILMSVYNEEKYISSAIESIINQSFSNWEIIIVDDQSTDGTYDLSSKLISNIGDKAILIRNPIKGKVNAFNLAYENCSGDIIILFGGDDILPKNSVELRSSALSQIQSDQSACVRAQYKIISEDPRYSGKRLPQSGNPPNHSGGILAINRLFAAEIFPIPTHFVSEDKWIGLHAKYRAQSDTYLNQVVLYYRIHPGNTVNRYGNFEIKQEIYSTRKSVEKYFIEKYPEISNIYTLEQSIKLEDYRQNSRLIKILFMRGVSSREKLKSISLMNKFFYYFGNKLST